MKKNKKRLLALLTSASIALSMSGCANSKKDYVLKDTIFDSTNYLSEKNVNRYHEHYRDITNGIKFTGPYCVNLDNYVVYFDIQKLGGISEYLTEEELNKSLTEKGLSDEEIINIIKRIQKEVKENSKVLTK